MCETDLWKTQRGTVRSITNIYSLGVRDPFRGTALPFRHFLHQYAMAQGKKGGAVAQKPKVPLRTGNGSSGCGIGLRPQECGALAQSGKWGDCPALSLAFSLFGVHQTMAYFIFFPPFGQLCN